MDTQTSIQRVVELAVHDLADWCAVDVLEASGELRRMGVARAEPRAVLTRPGADDFVQTVIKSGRPLVIPALVHLRLPGRGARRAWTSREVASLISACRSPVEGPPLSA
jgi:hypothetical protein